MTKPDHERSGTQSIERAASVLRELAKRDRFGLGLTELAARCELRKGTAHRILACLVRERLVQRRTDRRYQPGPLLFELGLSQRAHAAFQAACPALLGRAVRRTGGVVALYLRSGNEFVCIARVGSSTIKALTSEVGTRRPLVMSTGGVAILMVLPKDEARAAIAVGIRHLRRFEPGKVGAIEKMIRRSRAHGFGLNLGDVVPGINAFGVPIRDANGVPFGSMTVAGLARDFPPSRTDEIVQALREEAANVALAERRIFAHKP